MKRQELELSAGWEFLGRQPSGKWLKGLDPTADGMVNVPHCWNQTDTFQTGVAYRRGPGGYRRTITIPDQPGLQWFLECEGFYGLGELWIDGRRVARMDGEFLGFSIDLSDHVRPGRDYLVAICLTNRCPRHVLPGIRMPDFLLYGGLAGRCFLRGKPPLRLVEDGTTVRADSEGHLDIHYELVGGMQDVRCVVRAPDGSLAAETIGSGPLCCDVPEPQYWDVDQPDLYTAELSLPGGDSASVRFGIREAVFRGEEGFFLNQRRLPLHGCNRHEAIPGVGNALTPAMHRHDAELLKQFGCNLVRLSHYPQHPEFLDACDELGILVYAEIATWKSVRSGRWLRNACRQMARMIRRDRNHPSIILWGLGNESRKRKPYLALAGIARTLDPSRQTIYAENHIYRARREHTLDIPDVFGVNYEMRQLDEARQVSRTGAVLVSECASWPAPRGDRDAQIGQLHHIQKAWDAIGNRPFVAGFALWCFADYATLRKQRYTRYSGIVDAWRMPKPGAWLMKAAHHPHPFVKLIAEWGRSGAASRRILVFTNCDEVRVAADIILSGRRWYELNLEFFDAPLRARSTSDPSIHDSVSPWSPAVALRLSLTQEDLTVHAVDDAGVCDEDYSGPVTLETDPPLQLSIFRPDQTLHLAGGVGRVFVRPGTKPTRLRASAAGLTPAHYGP